MGFELEKLQITDLDLSNSKVLLRVDFNVPLDSAQNITDDTRIRRALPTIKYLLEKNCSIIILSHLGRPDGKVNTNYSLSPCAKHLAKLLDIPLTIANDCISEQTITLASRLKPKEILFLENLRFYEAEKHPKNDPLFAKTLASLGDYFINDAFGCAHRKHSSITEIPKYLPDRSAMGFLMQRELENFNKYLRSPKKPFFAVVGGSKVSSKSGVLASLLQQVDALFIGGAMAVSMLQAKGDLPCQAKNTSDILDICKHIFTISKDLNVPIFLPTDFIIADSLEKPASIKTTNLENAFPSNYTAYDIGPKTIFEWKNKIQDSQTIFWNGPLGVFEKKDFANGTFEIAKAISRLQCTKIAGGGDSVASINQLHIENKFTHLSTGGGAFLELIEHKTLPGIDALTDSK